MIALRFKIDENLPVEAAEILNRAGHDAISAFHQGLTGAADKSIAEVCQEEQRVLLTLDLDFADIRTYPPDLYAGLIVLRIKRQDKLAVMTVVERLVRALQAESPAQRLWIVDENRIRIRE